MQNIMVPYFQPGETLTAVASAPVKGGTFVAIGGARRNEMVVVKPATGADAIAVAGYDAAQDGRVTCHMGGVLDVVAAAALVAGDYVKSDANGQAIKGTAADHVGIAFDDIKAGARGPVNFGR